MTKSDLTERVRTLMKRRKGCTEKRMFGGIGFLLNGNMCCGTHKGRLILLLGIEGAEVALTEKHVKSFDITGKPMRGWVMINERYLDDDEELKSRVADAVKFASKLPAK